MQPKLDVSKKSKVFFIANWLGDINLQTFQDFRFSVWFLLSHEYEAIGQTGFPDTQEIIFQNEK